MTDRLDFLRFDPDFSSPDLVAAYDELPLWSALFGVLLLDEVPLAGVTAALDVGCGTGFPLIELAERLGPRAQVHGIDCWSAGLKRAAEKIANRRTPNATLHEGSAASLPFSDGQFELIVSNLGINNFDDPAAAMRECRRVSKAGATLAMTTNLQGHMHEFYATFDAVLAEVGDPDAQQRLHEHVEHRATVVRIRHLLETNGFSITRIVERIARMRFADATALFNHHFVKLAFVGDWKRIVPSQQSTVFTLLLRRLNDTAALQGELSLTIPMAYVEAIPA
jgi:arsenite methyltransferase